MITSAYTSQMYMTLLLSILCHFELLFVCAKVDLMLHLSVYINLELNI